MQEVKKRKKCEEHDKGSEERMAKLKCEEKRLRKLARQAAGNHSEKRDKRHKASQAREPEQKSMEAKVEIAQVPTAAGTTEGTTPEPRPAAAEDAGKPCEVDEKNQSDLEESFQKMQKATMKRYQESSRAPSEATEADYEVADAEPGPF